jgi:transcriptional regulator with XRE-family HTH domain
MKTKGNLVANFAQNLRSKCREIGLTHRELAERADVHYVHVSRILCGHTSPSVEVCEKLARAAGMRPDSAFLPPEKNSVEA